MGAGHLYRQLALAEHAVASAWPVTFCAHRTLPPALRARLAQAEGLKLKLSSHPRASFQEAAWVRALCQERSISAVIVDGYHFSAEYIEALHGDDTLKVIVFEDDGSRSARADLVVNISPGAERIDYGALPGAPELALGPSYALLRRQFLAHRPTTLANAPAEVTRVLLTLGGGDMSGELETALLGLSAARYPHRCDLMSGSIAPERLGALRALCEAEFDFEVVFHRDVEQVAALMAPQQLAICAAGGTSWELASLGVPMLQVELFENQRLVARHLSDQGVTAFLGARDAFKPARLGQLLGELMRRPDRRLEMAKKGFALVDARGAERLLDRIARL